MICKCAIIWNKYPLLKHKMPSNVSFGFFGHFHQSISFRNLNCSPYFLMSNKQKNKQEFKIESFTALMDRQDKIEYYLNFNLNKFNSFLKNKESQITIKALKNKIQLKASYKGFFSGKLIENSKKVS